MKKAYIVGTKHDLQQGKIMPDEFATYLQGKCREHGIALIAEEINGDATRIVAKEVSNSLGIRHLIIDPKPSEYDRLSVTEIHVIEYEVMQHYDLKVSPLSSASNTPSEAVHEFESRMRHEHCDPRELEWLRRIKECDTWPVLVICGSFHYDSFCKLMSEHDIETEKLHHCRGCNQ